MIRMEQKSSIYYGQVYGQAFHGLHGRAMAAEIEGSLCAVLIIPLDSKRAFDLPHECIIEG